MDLLGSDGLFESCSTFYEIVLHYLYKQCRDQTPDIFYFLILFLLRK